MDDLTDRVRRVYADQPAPDDVDADVLLGRVHAGAARRVRRRKAALAGAAGVAVLVVIGGVGSGMYLLGDPSDTMAAQGGDAGAAESRAEANDSAPEAGEKDGGTAQDEQSEVLTAPAPANLSATSLTAVSTETFWVLGTADGEPALARTDNGGETFDSLALPGEQLELSSDTAVEAGVRFADEDNGWYFGAQLYATHDGARTWAPVDEPGPVDQLEAAGGYAYALSGKQLWRSSTTDDSWRALDVELTDPESLAVSDDLVVVTDRDETGTTVVVSGNAGESFDDYATPCAPELAAGEVSAATDDGLWLSCPTGMAASLLHSTDGGQRWEPVSTDGEAPPNSAVLAARDTKSAVVAYNGTAIEVGESRESTESGAVPGLGQPTYAGFTTPEVGYLIDADGALFRTADGGASWDRVEFG